MTTVTLALTPSAAASPIGQTSAIFCLDRQNFSQYYVTIQRRVRIVTILCSTDQPICLAFDK